MSSVPTLSMDTTSDVTQMLVELWMVMRVPGCCRIWLSTRLDRRAVGGDGTNESIVVTGTTAGTW